MCPPPPPFQNISLPKNNNNPTIGRATEFDEIEGIKHKLEVPKVDIKHEIDKLIKNIPSAPRIKVSDGILNVLGDAEDVINNDFIKVDEFEDKDIQEIKDGYNFDDKKMNLMMEKFQKYLNFFYGGEGNEKLRIYCEMLGLTDDNGEFIDYLCSTPGEQMLLENSISIHLERGNLFYDNFNNQESFYTFLLNQQDKNKKIIKKKYRIAIRLKLFTSIFTEF